MSEPDKKQIIVRAAYAVLSAQGLQGLSFETVASEAGLSRQLVRYYFEDTEALMLALCDYLAELYRTALVGGVSALDQSRRLDFFLDFYFDLLDAPRKPRDDQVYDAAIAFAAGSPNVRGNLKLQYGLLGQVISHEMQVQYPELSSEDCLELSYLFVCLMYGHWKMVASLGYDECHNAKTRRAMDRLIASFQARSLRETGEPNAWTAAP